jgi:hypothetical protein
MSVNRRDVLRMLGIGATGIALPPTGSQSRHLGLTEEDRQRRTVALNAVRVINTVQLHHSIRIGTYASSLAD